VKSTSRKGGGKVLERKHSWLEYGLTGVFDASTGDERLAWQLGKANLDQTDKWGGVGHHDGHLVYVQELTR